MLGNDVIRTLKLLLEQSDPFTKKQMDTGSIRWVVGSLLIVGIVLSNAYKDKNVYNMISPVLATPYTRFQELVANRFEIFTRLAPISDFSAKAFANATSKYGIIYVPYKEAYKGMLPEALEKPSNGFYKYAGDLLGWAMGKKLESQLKAIPYSDRHHIYLSPIKRNLPLPSIMNMLISQALYVKVESEISSLDWSENQKYPRRSIADYDGFDINRIGKYFDNTSIKYYFMEHTKLLGSTEKFLYEIKQDYKPEDKFWRDNLVRKERNAMHEALAQCKGQALVLPPLRCFAEARKLAQERRSDFNVGKVPLFEVKFRLELKGRMVPRVLPRVRAFKEQGMWERWKSLLKLRFLERNTIGELSPPTMKGNVQIIFMIVGMGWVLGLICFWLVEIVIIKVICKAVLNVLKGIYLGVLHSRVATCLPKALVTYAEKILNLHCCNSDMKVFRIMKFRGKLYWSK